MAVRVIKRSSAPKVSDSASSGGSNRGHSPQLGAREIIAITRRDTGESRRAASIADPTPRRHRSANQGRLHRRTVSHQRMPIDAMRSRVLDRRRTFVEDPIENPYARATLRSSVHAIRFGNIGTDHEEAMTHEMARHESILLVCRSKTGQGQYER